MILTALLTPVSVLTTREKMPSPLFNILALTPEIPFKLAATLVKVPVPEPTVTDELDKAELTPNVDAECPTVTVPEPTVDPGVILVTLLNTLVPVEVAPSPAPVITSVIAFPAISFPTTVKLVEL